MDCVNPTQAWICGKVLSKDGVISPRLEFSAENAQNYYCGIFGFVRGLAAMKNHEISLPCGKCPNCLARKRKEMATKLCNENSCYENACFVTLTYDDDHVPVTDCCTLEDPHKTIKFGSNNGPIKTLLPEDVQKFIKRLRSKLTYRTKLKHDGRDYVDKIRYFAVGEYGGRTQRPHYHIIIFNWFPSDAVPLKGHDYTSEQIKQLWPFGFHLLSRVNSSACKYCAQYVTKKLIKKDNATLAPYRVPEFTRQSIRNGGMGIPWLKKYHTHVSAVGYVTYRHNGLIIKANLPQTYLRALRKYFPAEWLDLRDRKMEYCKNHSCVLPDDVLYSRTRYNINKALQDTLKGVL